MKKSLYILLCAAFLAACSSYPDSDFTFITGEGTGGGASQARYVVVANATAGGDVLISPEQADYAQGAKVTLTAQPQSGYEFGYWDDGCMTSVRKLTVSQNYYLTATFLPVVAPYHVKLFGSLAGTVSKYPDLEEYAPGTEVTITATPISGYKFEKWSDGNTDATRTLIVNQNIVLSASFVQNVSTPSIVSDIPSDDDATDAPSVISTGTLTNSTAVTGLIREGQKVVRVDLSGISDLSGGFLNLFGTNSINCNVWITIDDTDNKGIQVIKIESGSGTTANADVTFLIDNSGSMSEEADAVANSIVEWANLLTSSGLDVRFSCVGYDGEINGGIDFTTGNDLKTFLDRSTGTYRTVGFEGANATQLEGVVDNYRTGGGSSNECGVAALRFADENYTFRAGASRIYINFTDEPNQPNGKTSFSVEYLNPIKNLWSSSQGTVHSVYSDSYQTFTPNPNYEEQPWLMADYTGGTKKFTDSSFSGITLSDLPVTGALQNTHAIYFTNIEALLDGLTHKVVITIKDACGVEGVIVLYINFSSLTFI